jgi:hypothetical protein
MSFFESLPEPPPRPARVPMTRSPWMSSETVIPGSVAGELLLVRTEAVAVALGSLRAYPNGLKFVVHVRLRRDDQSSPYGLHDPFGEHDPLGRGKQQDDLLRLGVLFADGRRTVNESGWKSERDYSESGEPLLRAEGSGGSSRYWDGDFWLYPLPPDGPLTFIVSWPAYGITEARGELDAAAIRAAAARAVDLWPDDLWPDDPDEAPTSSSRSSTITATGSAEPGPESE